MTSADPLSSVISSLQHDKIIPDVIPTDFNPTMLFSIVWPNRSEAMLGNELTVESTAEEPTIDFTPMNMPVEQADSLSSGDEVSYTLVMLDPDAPYRKDPIYRSFRHWVITGLKSPADTASKTSNLTALKSKPATTPYRPPGPRPNSGVHRYTFLLFQEPPNLVIPESAPEHGAALEERRSWDPIKFANQYGLKLVGANYFLVRSEEQAE
ncbi:PEBP-like protein [Cristinia sonorae]|uniref:PEBP-like protein n=1 Tax=Cristinia sonorae TaxID=1940300 RepID=A0A8K0ULF0_9AGAR|nr:PEBP-like protein [Cristinia sonorae]